MGRAGRGLLPRAAGHGKAGALMGQDAPGRTAGTSHRPVPLVEHRQQGSGCLSSCDNYGTAGRDRGVNAVDSVRKTLRRLCSLAPSQ